MRWEVARMKLLGGALLVLAVGCVSNAAFEPAHRKAGQSPAVLYKSAVRVLVGQGFEIEDKDAEVGLVTTKWRDADQILLTKRQLRWRVMVDKGELAVHSDCQFGSDDPSQGWSPCGADKQTEGRSEEAARLADAILAAAH